MIRFGFVSLLALTLAGPASDPPAKPKTHGYPLSGTVGSVDEARKTFVVKNSAGKEITLVWTNATTVVGGKLKTGEKVTLRYLDKDGKHIVTTVPVGEPSAAKSTPGAATPAPAKQFPLPAAPASVGEGLAPPRPLVPYRRSDAARRRSTGGLGRCASLRMTKRGRARGASRGRSRLRPAGPGSRRLPWWADDDLLDDRQPESRPLGVSRRAPGPGGRTGRRPSPAPPERSRAPGPATSRYASSVAGAGLDLDGRSRIRVEDPRWRPGSRRAEQARPVAEHPGRRRPA